MEKCVTVEVVDVDRRLDEIQIVRGQPVRPLTNRRWLEPSFDGAWPRGGQAADGACSTSAQKKLVSHVISL